MALMQRAELGKRVGVSARRIWGWVSRGLLKPAYPHEHSPLFDDTNEAEARSLKEREGAKSRATVMREAELSVLKEAGMPRPVVNVDVAGIVEVLMTIDRHILVAEETARTRHAELLASLRTQNELMRQLIEAWKGGGS